MPSQPWSLQSEWIIWCGWLCYVPVITLIFSDFSQRMLESFLFGSIRLFMKIITKFYNYLLEFEMRWFNIENDVCQNTEFTFFKPPRLKWCLPKYDSFWSLPLIHCYDERVLILSWVHCSMTTRVDLRWMGNWTKL